MTIRRRVVTRLILIKAKRPASRMTVPLYSGNLKRPVPQEAKMRAFEQPHDKSWRPGSGAGAQLSSRPRSLADLLHQTARAVSPSTATGVSTTSPAGLNQQKQLSGGSRPRTLREHLRAKSGQSSSSGSVPDPPSPDPLARASRQSGSMLDVPRVEGAIFSDGDHGEEE